MRRGTHLWQHIFFCALALILVAHTASYVIFNLASRKFEALQLMAEITSDTADSLAGGTVEELNAYVKIFNNPQGKLWLEQPDGTLIMGVPVSGFEPGRRDFPVNRLEGRSSGKSWNKLWAEKPDAPPADTPSGSAGLRVVSIFETGLPDAEFIGTMPVPLDGRQSLLFLVFDKYQPLPAKSLFLDGLIAVVVIGGLLALWAAKKISLPLQRLRNEVLDIAAGDLSKRVSGKGEGEISELAAAVNKLADDLSRKIASGQELIANISHELRSPIGRINLSAAIMEDGMRDEYGDARDLPEKAGTRFRHLRIIQDEAARLDALIGSSLLSSRLDLQRDLALFPVDFSALCGEVSQSYDTLMESRELAFERDIRPGLWVQGDEPTLCTMVSNLLDNALKYTEKGGRVRLAVTHAGDDAVLTVENSHAPMPDAWLRDIFAPFCRGNIATGDGEGVGLGLCLVKKIAALHHGHVDARNGSIGVRFTFSLKLDRNFPR